MIRGGQAHKNSAQAEVTTLVAVKLAFHIWKSSSTPFAKVLIFLCFCIEAFNHSNSSERLRLVLPVHLSCWFTSFLKIGLIFPKAFQKTKPENNNWSKHILKRHHWLMLIKGKIMKFMGVNYFLQIILGQKPVPTNSLTPSLHRS